GLFALRPILLFGPAEPSFRPGRTLYTPTFRVAVKNARGSRARKGLFFTATRAAARWRRTRRGGRAPCAATIRSHPPSALGRPRWWWAPTFHAARSPLR